ncbi:MAG: hypothetical protein ACXVHK_32465 [Solirubrobacteraceae bacterium]
MSLMILVVGSDLGEPLRRHPVSAGRSERLAWSGGSDAADTPQSVVRVPAGGHDGRLAAG